MKNTSHISHDTRTHDKGHVRLVTLYMTFKVWPGPRTLVCLIFFLVSVTGNACNTLHSLCVSFVCVCLCVCMWVEISHRLNATHWEYEAGRGPFTVCVKGFNVCVSQTVSFPNHEGKKWNQCPGSGLFNMSGQKESIVLFIELGHQTGAAQRGRLRARTSNSYVTSYRVHSWKLSLRVSPVSRQSAAILDGDNEPRYDHSLCETRACDVWRTCLIYIRLWGFNFVKRFYFVSFINIIPI